MNIIADMHTHTVASTHAYSTVKEMTEAARDKGLEFLAITDHTPLSTDGPHIWHFHNLHKAIPRELFGVKIIYGAESSVTDYEGHIDLPENECKALDWIIGSVHTDILPSGTEEQNTNAYLGLAENPLVDVIGHPANVKFPFDYEKGIKAFKEHDKLVEINESTLLWKNAHFFTAVGQVSRSMELLKKFDYPRELIVNTDRALLLERINRKNGIIFS